MSGLQAGQFSTLVLQSSAVVINAVCRLALLGKAFSKRDVIWMGACYSKTSIYLPVLMVPFKNMQVASCIGANAPPLSMVWRFSTLPQSIVNELWLSISGFTYDIFFVHFHLHLCIAKWTMFTESLGSVLSPHRHFHDIITPVLMQCCPRAWRQDS